MRFAPSSLILAVALVGANSGPTPQAAANALFAREAPLQFTKVNVVEPYAVVRFKTVSFGSAGSFDRILVRHYAFGWQTVDDIGDDACRFTARGIPKRVQTQLAVDIGKLTTQPGGCRADDMSNDYGNASDVSAVRAILARDAWGFIPGAIVVGPYAEFTQYMMSGETGIYGRFNHAWHYLAGGGGYMDRGLLVAFGVPANVAACLEPQGAQRPPSCAAIPSDPTPKQTAMMVVEHYYSLWNAHEFGEMYAMLSTSYRAAHPFAAWKAEHQSSIRLDVMKAQALSPTLVAVSVFSDEPKAGHDYKGTWTLVNENGELRLASPDLHEVPLGKL